VHQFHMLDGSERPQRSCDASPIGAKTFGHFCLFRVLISFDRQAEQWDNRGILLI
jgi:hypothetical protein